MIFAEQLRAARALLGWNQQQLAVQSKVGLATIRRLEAQSGPIRAISETVWRIQNCLKESGVEFIEEEDSKGPGVRLAIPTSHKVKTKYRSKS
jgi:transcriptional regulator with XRE-family HTH domain